MKKRGVLVVLTFLLAFPISSLTALASESNLTGTELKDSIVQKKVIDTLSIEKYSDGRVRGIKNIDLLNTSQKEIILKEMRLTDEEINRMPEKLIDDLITTGGVKVDTKTEYSEEYYSLDGQTYVVNDENRALIQKIKEADINTIKGESESPSNFSLTPESVNSLGLSAYHLLMYNGKTGNAKEFQYSYLTYYTHSISIIPSGIDKIGTSWSIHATRIGAKAYGIKNSNNITIPVDVSSIYGTSTEFLPGSYDRGYMQNDVNIPVTHVGTTAAFASKYAHCLTPFSPTVQFGGAMSISFSTFVGTSSDWSDSFTIGNSGLN